MISRSRNWPSHELPFFKLSNRHSLFSHDTFILLFFSVFYLVVFFRFGTKSMSMASSPRQTPRFFFLAFPVSFSPSRFVAVVVSPPPGFQDYDENLTRAKVVPVRHTSHFSGTAWRTRFSASPSWNFHGRMALKSLSRHPFKGWFCRVEFTHKLNKKKENVFLNIVSDRNDKIIYSYNSYLFNLIVIFKDYN